MPAAGTPPAWRQARKPCRENPSCRARRPARPWLFSAAPVSRSCLCPLILCAHGLAVRILDAQQRHLVLVCVILASVVPLAGVLNHLVACHILVLDSLPGGSLRPAQCLLDRAFLIPRPS